MCTMSAEDLARDTALQFSTPSITTDGTVPGPSPLELLDIVRFFHESPEAALELAEQAGRQFDERAR